MNVLVIVIGSIAVVAVVAVGFVYLFPETALRRLMGAARRHAGLVRKEISLPDGVRYVFLDGGKGEPLMLLHGFGADKDNFVQVARRLTPRYRVIVPDHIGFGESAHPQGVDYSPPAQARRLHSLADALGIKQLHLGGNSMGGQIAITYAALYPAEVASLWLLDPAGVWSAPATAVRRAYDETGDNQLVVRSDHEFARLIALTMSKPPFIPAPIRRVMANERIANFDLEQGIFEQIYADSVEARVAGLATPALIVWGEQDRLLHPASAEVLRKLMPNSRVIMMRDTGHLPMLEQPRRTAEDYLQFRASVPAAARAAN